MQDQTQVNDLFSRPVMKPLFVSLGLMLFQQFTGINAIVFYTVSIFQSAGSTIDGRFATIIIGAVYLVFSIASGFLVYNAGLICLLKPLVPDFQFND